MALFSFFVSKNIMICTNELRRTLLHVFRLLGKKNLMEVHSKVLLSICWGTTFIFVVNSRAVSQMPAAVSFVNFILELLRPHFQEWNYKL